VLEKLPTLKAMSTAEAIAGEAEFWKSQMLKQLSILPGREKLPMLLLLAGAREPISSAEAWQAKQVVSCALLAPSTDKAQQHASHLHSFLLTPSLELGDHTNILRKDVGECSGNIMYSCMKMEKMRHFEAITGMAGRIRENDGGGEFNYNIL
jgi:hypothetical protein